MKMQNRLRFIILLFIFIGSYSCQISKEIPLEGISSSAALQKMTKKERLNNILQAEIQYNQFSANLKFIIQLEEKGKETSLEAQLRIVKNETIQLSLRMPFLNIEIGKILITPNDMLIIDRLNKQYLKESIQDIKATTSFNFDYYTLEALLTNRLFIPDKKEILPSDYSNFDIQEDTCLINIINTDKYNTVYHFVTDYTNRIQSITIRKEGNQSQCKYTDYELITDNKSFPMSAQFIFNNYKLNLSFKLIEINTDFTVDYSTPNKYKQITLQQFFLLIESLL